MDRNEAEQILLSTYDAAKNGLLTEHSKLDLKRQWWDLSDKSGTEEFAKDLAAIANAPGDVGIIILGLDENGSVYDASIATTGLNEADIQGKANAFIDPRLVWEVHEFELAGKTVSVLAIPKSLSRPHVVRTHRGRPNCIFIRRGTQTGLANRFELDEMFGDRSHVADAALYIHATSLPDRDDSDFDLVCSLITGSRGIVITQAAANLLLDDSNAWPVDIHSMFKESAQHPDQYGPRSENFPVRFPANSTHKFLLYGEIDWSDVRARIGSRTSYKLTFTATLFRTEGSPIRASHVVRPSHGSGKDPSRAPSS